MPYTSSSRWHCFYPFYHSLCKIQCVSTIASKFYSLSYCIYTLSCRLVCNLYVLFLSAVLSLLSSPYHALLQSIQSVIRKEGFDGSTPQVGPLVLFCCLFFSPVLSKLLVSCRLILRNLNPEAIKRATIKRTINRVLGLHTSETMVTLRLRLCFYKTFHLSFYWLVSVGGTSL